MYELMLITKADDTSESMALKVEKMLGFEGAADIQMIKLGKKTLSYPIAKQTEGEYFLFNFNIGGDKINILNNALRLEQELILRYLIIKAKLPTKTKTVKQITESKKPKVTAKVTVRTKTAKVADTGISKTTTTKKGKTKKVDN